MMFLKPAHNIRANFQSTTHPPKTFLGPATLWLDVTMLPWKQPKLNT